MKNQTAISELLSAEKPVFSVEFFPPKTEAGARQILRTAKDLQAFDPDFVSITYGAGGSTRERTLEYGELLQDIFGFEVMPHLTCVGHAKQELEDTLTRFQKSGFNNIMTLRGDPPKGETEFTPHPDGLRYASELVSFIKEKFPTLCLGVAGYPEKHPEATSLDADLQNLKHKVDQGADFITTQLFFDNSDYFSFVEKCRALEITIPILPGILTPLSLEQVQKFCAFCQASIPSELESALKKVEGDEKRSAQVGIEWATRQITELLKRGAPGFHLYIMNRSESTIELLNALKKNAVL